MRYFYLCLSILVILLDRWTKTLVVAQIALGESVPVFRHFLNLTNSQNPGIAFGLFGLNPTPMQNWILVSLSILAIIVVGVLAWRYPANKVGYQVSFALIIGGAAGNLWDRIIYGQVTDFIDVFVRDHHWPVFNVADSAISVGVIGLAIGLIFFDKHDTEEKSEEVQGNTSP